MRNSNMDDMRDIPDTRRDRDADGRDRRMPSDMMMHSGQGIQMPGMSRGMAKGNKTQVAENVYNILNEHMCKAVAFHEQLADYFCFLGLYGYKRMLEYHYLTECAEKRKLHKRYIDVHKKILPVKQVQIPIFIPADWSRYTVEDIDDTVVSKFVRAALNEWKSWEEKTKDLYEEQCETLKNAGLVSDYNFVEGMIEDVEKEIKKVIRIIESLNGTGYDATMIHGMQDKYHEKYKKKYEDHFTTKNNYPGRTYGRYVPPYYDEDDEEMEIRPRRYGFV